MEPIDFSQPVRQSSKGIVIIFAFNTIKIFKNFFVVFLSLGIILIRKNSFIELNAIIIMLIILGILMLILIFSVLNFLNFKFHLSNDDFHLASGIINKDTTIIPKAKIQNVYIKQNLLQQIINVVSLNIETAGDNKSEIEIKALDKSTALRLKNELFAKKYAASEATATANSDKVFFRVSSKRLLLEGLLQNHLKSLVFMASFVIGLYYEFRDFIYDLDLSTYFNRFISYENGSILKLVYIIVVITSIVLIISFLFSIIKIFIVNFQLEVIENQKTIEINKGLFNKVSLILTPNKIQNIVVKTNVLKEYFNLYSIQVKQAMANKKLSKNLGVIALEKEQLHQLIKKLLPDYSDEGETYKPDLYYKRILMIKSFLTLAAINVIGFSFFDANFLWVNLIMVPMLIILAVLRFKKAHFKITDQFVSVGSGAIVTTTNILEINKIQAVSLRQSFFQKRKSIFSVEIYTASKAVKIPFIIEKDAKFIHDFLIFKVESQHRDWM